jgi:hypothetical protein
MSYNIYYINTIIYYVFPSYIFRLRQDIHFTEGIKDFPYDSQYSY